MILHPDRIIYNGALRATARAFAKNFAFLTYINQLLHSLVLLSDTKQIGDVEHFYETKYPFMPPYRWKSPLFRKKRGMTQKDLAARLQTRGCNITHAMVGHIETGYRTASVFEIDMLVEVLGIDYNALFARD